MVEIIKITYRNGAYYVDRPNWDGGEVVPVGDYATLADENERLKAEVKRLARELAEMTEIKDVHSEVRAKYFARAKKAETEIERLLDGYGKLDADIVLMSLLDYFEKLAKAPAKEHPHFPNGCRPFSTGDVRHFALELRRILSALTTEPAAPQEAEAVNERGKQLWHIIADAARNLLDRPPERRGPYRFNEEQLREIAALVPRTKTSHPPAQAVTEAMVEAASREYMRIFDKHLLSKHARLILTAAQEAS